MLEGSKITSAEFQENPQAVMDVLQYYTENIKEEEDSLPKLDTHKMNSHSLFPSNRESTSPVQTTGSVASRFQTTSNESSRFQKPAMHQTGPEEKAKLPSVSSKTKSGMPPPPLNVILTVSDGD